MLRSLLATARSLPSSLMSNAVTGFWLILRVFLSNQEDASQALRNAGRGVPLRLAPTGAAEFTTVKSAP